VSAAPDFGAGEPDLDTVNLFGPTRYSPGSYIEMFGYLDPVEINGRMVSSLRHHIDQHREGQRIIERRILGVDQGIPGNRVPAHNGKNLRPDECDNIRKSFLVLHLIPVESFDEVLPGVNNYLSGNRHLAQPVHRPRIKFECTLVFQLPQYVLLDLVERAAGVDEVVVKNSGAIPVNRTLRTHSFVWQDTTERNLRYTGRLPGNHLPTATAFYIYDCSAQGHLRLATIGDSRHPGKRRQDRRVAINTNSLLFVLDGLVLKQPCPK
jgi:hypothetical protein